MSELTSRESCVAAFFDGFRKAVAAGEHDVDAHASGCAHVAAVTAEPLQKEIERLRAALRPFAEMARPNEDETKQGHGETIVARGYASDMTVITSGDVATAGRAMWPKHGCDPDVWGLPVDKK